LKSFSQEGCVLKVMEIDYIWRHTKVHLRYQACGRDNRDIPGCCCDVEWNVYILRILHNFRNTSAAISFIYIYIYIIETVSCKSWTSSMFSAVNRTDFSLTNEIEIFCATKLRTYITVWKVASATVVPF
jgi:hypothetical protein